MHDLGIFSGFLMLSIEAHGLGSLPAYTSISYPMFQREILGIPDDKKIVAGIIFGYPVKKDKDSQVVMPRVPLEEVHSFQRHLIGYVALSIFDIQRRDTQCSHKFTNCLVLLECQE